MIPNMADLGDDKTVETFLGVATAGKSVYIRVNGDGVALVCPTLKAFINRMMRDGRNDFIVDLNRCDYVDSCFMGTLVEVVLEGRGRVVVINTRPKVRQRFELLGLTQILPVKGRGVDVPRVTLHRLRIGGAGKRELARVVESAHRSLIRADDRNRTRFEPLLRTLRKELEDS